MVSRPRRRLKNSYTTATNPLASAFWLRVVFQSPMLVFVGLLTETRDSRQLEASPHHSSNHTNIKRCRIYRGVFCLPTFCRICSYSLPKRKAEEIVIFSPQSIQSQTRVLDSLTASQKPRKTPKGRAQHIRFVSLWLASTKNKSWVDDVLAYSKHRLCAAAEVLRTVVLPWTAEESNNIHPPTLVFTSISWMCHEEIFWPVALGQLSLEEGSECLAGVTSE